MGCRLIILKLLMRRAQFASKKTISSTTKYRGNYVSRVARNVFLWSMQSIGNILKPLHQATNFGKKIWKNR